MRRIIKTSIVIFILLIITSCNQITNKPVLIRTNDLLPTTFEVGSQLIDFSEYFVVKKQGIVLDIMQDMLDLSEVDFSQVGTFKVTVSYEFESIIYNKTITFTVIPKQVIINQQPLSTVLTVANQTVVKTSGIVEAIVGQRAYLVDNNMGIMLLLEADEPLIKVGNKVIITGTKDSLNLLPVLRNITQVDLVSSNQLLSQPKMSDLSESSLNHNLCSLVKIEDAEVVELPQSYSTEQDIVIKVKLNDVIRDLVVSKDLGNDIQKNILTSLSTLKLGNKINIEAYITFSHSLELVRENTITIIDEEPKTPQPLSIASVLAAVDGSVVTTSGTVVGMVGNNAYLFDGVNGIYIYIGLTANQSIVIGNQVTLTGTKVVYRGLPEIKDLTSVVVDKTNQVLPEPTLINSLEDNILGQLLCQLVSIKQVTIVTLPTSYTTTKDTKITIKINNNEKTLFISKNLDTTIQNNLFTIIKTLKVGDKIDISHVFVSSFDNYQLEICNTNSIVKSVVNHDDLMISEVVKKANNTKVTTSGVVTSIIGNNVYIQDSTAGIYLYNGSNQSFQSSLVVGNLVQVTGIFKTFNGLPELEKIEKVTVLSTNQPLPTVAVLLSVDQATLADYLCERVSLTALTVVSLPSSYNLTSDTSFTLALGADRVNVFISRHLDDSVQSSLFALLQTATPGGTLDLNAVIVSSYNAIQLELYAASNIQNVSGAPYIEPGTYDPNTDYELLQDVLDSVGLPSKGDVTALVIPIEFSDYPFSSKAKTDIEAAFFGTSSTTGWESLKTYYQKVSYGLLNISGTVVNPIRVSQKASYYEVKYDAGIDADWLILEEALTVLENLGFDFSQYDGDQNGDIDAIYLVYSRPYETSENASDLWWAYQYNYYGDATYDGVVPNYYMFASVDFLYDQYVGFNGLNATTFIHETGHLLGLDDYYDYNYVNSFLGGADMMDATVGDHNSFSKLMMGWVKPIVVTTNTTLSLRPFESSGDVVMMLLDWNGTYFSEYLLIDFYTPTGVNQAFTRPQLWDDGLDYYTDIYSIPGIRIYHVDATIDHPYVETGTYPATIFDNNNSDTLYPLLKLIEADEEMNFESGFGYNENDDLFQVGDIFGLNKWANYLTHDYRRLNFTIKVETISSTATLSIIFQ